MSHQLFDELIGTPPPVRVDVPGIVRRERRGRAARRLGGSLAAVLVLAGGVAVAVPGQQSGPPPVAAAPDTRFRLLFDTSESADVTARRLSQELDRALQEVAPGATWFWMPEYVGEERKPDGQPPTFIHNGTTDLVVGNSGVSYQGRRGALGISISADLRSQDDAGFHWPCRLPPGIQEDSRYRWVCAEGRSPSGGRTKTQTQTYTGRRQLSVQHLIIVELPDKRRLEVSITNMVGVDESVVPAQPESPLSQEQVTAIAWYLEGRVKS
ncbi:hypothetical protein AB0D32_04160 [Micromonospora sp. NPDC048170]|uniref:hypothetical protein n=1 Tax=Micromonospora sp. NPDC048170 TaxID=3154819 RepID=UPI0034104CA3